ncbi:MAG: hypothetical protein ACHP65_03185 [Legionellales bacterium]
MKEHFIIITKKSLCLSLLLSAVVLQSNAYSTNSNPLLSKASLSLVTDEMNKLNRAPIMSFPGPCPPGDATWAGAGTIHTITIVNNGAGPASNINTSYSSNSSAFTITSSSCSQVNANGGTCSITIQQTGLVAVSTCLTITMSGSNADGSATNSVSFSNFFT